MQWLKFSLVLIFTLQSSVSLAQKFSSSQCLDSEYKTEIEHKGKFFGLIENRISFKKNKCQIEVRFKGILETLWKIDVCREPIHMKVTSKGSQDVYKREQRCDEDTKSDFCYYRNELIESVQDHGLIYAKGQREKLTDSHGQTYCVFLLLQRYLDDGIVFSSFEKPKDIYNEQQACDLPQKKKNKKIYEPKIEKQDKAQLSSPLDSHTSLSAPEAMMGQGAKESTEEVKLEDALSDGKDEDKPKF